MPYVHAKSIAISFMSFQPTYTWNGVSQRLLIHQTSPYFFWCCLECIRSLDIHLIGPLHKCDIFFVIIGEVELSGNRLFLSATPQLPKNLRSFPARCILSPVSLRQGGRQVFLLPP